ncbi:AUGMIN subunit 2-like isoform X1 [Vicia villosa]|uniref:AUGMIN subunit 2-like isoform X1 n=1 Tax=Vicia villosa TaxID=3911 RepID=UPI00273C595B|nr:AUGMIN subunit 2-like isoform X1 [Vicia villosa]XP_058739828.1 AUGMIN subunit 2-like isoform X1 [Vicia villosa]
MSVSSASSSVGRKPVKRGGGMSTVLSIANDLGFSVSTTSSRGGLQNSSPTTTEKDEDLIKVLRELAAIQRKIADLEIELQRRKDDETSGYLTCVSEMEKKIETLSRITTILKDFIQNKDRIIARLQQPYSQHCVPVEVEYQRQFSELLKKAASDYGTLTASLSDLHWSRNFKEPPSVWGEMLRPIPVALAYCTRYFEAMSATRESFVALQKLREGNFDSSQPRTPTSDSSQPRTPTSDSSQILRGVSDCLTPFTSQ